MSEKNKETFNEEQSEEIIDKAPDESESTESEDTEQNEAVDKDQEVEEVDEIKKHKNKKEKKDKKDAQIDDLTDRLKRSMAEFDNFRKRTEKEKSLMYEIGARNIIEKILPVIDNFERGLSTVTNKDDPFADGMEKVYKQLMTTLEELGVEPIEAINCSFDLNLHNAVMHVEDEEHGENVIIEEFQKGYTYRDTVIRHSMVKVAN